MARSTTSGRKKRPRHGGVCCRVEPPIQPARWRRPKPCAARARPSSARVVGSGTPMSEARYRKRASECSVVFMALASRRPVETTPRPRPAITFSLKRTDGARAGPLNTTNRTEFEPMSMTACRPESATSFCRSAISALLLPSRELPPAPKATGSS